MKIGIITFTEGYNYGNKLQNFALLNYLKQLNNGDVVTVNNHVSTVSFKDKIIISLKSLWPSAKHKAYRVRQRRFNKFNRKYLNLTEQKLTAGTKEFPEADCFVCGSDQIWNPNYYDNIDAFVGKIPDGKKSISYAASFGVSSLPEGAKARYAKSLSYLHAVSVREEQGEKICEELGISNAQVHIDPTFLLDRECWLKHLSKPEMDIPKRYVFTYFIGAVPEEADKEIERFCKKNKCKRIDLNSTEHLEYFTFDPFEFLYLLYHSEFIFTDSFHASVFSIIFGKRFIVFRRVISASEQMHSRLETLLGLFKLEGHLYDRFSGDYESLDICSKDVEKIVSEQRGLAKDYFDKHLFS